MYRKLMLKRKHPGSSPSVNCWREPTENALLLIYMEYNFYKIDTLNQGTPYDYNSVMQYERNAFSKNNRPTMAEQTVQVLKHE
ncbi:low choriolytic enzyme-like [Solea senegalensis]|uniref:Low choriolytic enzyme-like n=1 Tax=Solea senegalensis TaxID=28829 RepID=A0AAV6Q625_SOLSE|nr:low choriolytic enzyme-like [Solea senegalensis]